MPYNRTIERLWSIARNFHGPPMSENRHLNPIHLAIAKWGYKIQSDELHIPDRFGYFSPGPPRLQAYQGYLIAELILILCCYTTAAAVFIPVISCVGASFFRLAEEILKLAYFIVVQAVPMIISSEESPFQLVKRTMILAVALMASLWAKMCLANRRRALDFDWEGERVTKILTSRRHMARCWILITMAIIWAIELGCYLHDRYAG